jgi:hypothetical protein
MDFKLTSAKLSPECLRWSGMNDLEANRGGENFVQSSGQRIEESDTEGKRSNNNNEIELYRQIFARSWREAVWDSIPAYSITSAAIRSYLESLFGDHDFQIHVSALAALSFDWITWSPLVLTKRFSWRMMYILSGFQDTLRGSVTLDSIEDILN